MTIEIPTSAYKERRYSRPWIALVNFATDAKGVFSFGDFVGLNGEQGMLVITNVIAGDIIATGQKDYRNPRNSSPEWHFINIAGELVSLDSKVEAYQRFKDEAEIRLQLRRAEANNVH